MNDPWRRTRSTARSSHAHNIRTKHRTLFSASRRAGRGGDTGASVQHLASIVPGPTPSPSGEVQMPVGTQRYYPPQANATTTTSRRPRLDCRPHFPRRNLKRRDALYVKLRDPLHINSKLRDRLFGPSAAGRPGTPLLRDPSLDSPLSGIQNRQQPALEESITNGPLFSCTQHQKQGYYPRLHPQKIPTTSPPSRNLFDST